jgi:glutaconate CoA-transferase, subunit B
VVGSYHNPKVRLPGAGGAPEISSSAREVLIVLPQSTRAFVEKLDFITTAGFLNGGTGREGAGPIGNAPAAVITDLCILRPDPSTRELTVTHIHPGVSRETIVVRTGWAVQFAPACSETAPPMARELDVLRALKANTAAAYGAEGEAA